MTQRQIQLSGYFSSFEFQFEKEMTVKLEKTGDKISLSLKEPSSELTQQEVETLISLVNMALDFIMPI